MQVNSKPSYIIEDYKPVCHNSSSLCNLSC